MITISRSFGALISPALTVGFLLSSFAQASPQDEKKQAAAKSPKFTDQQLEDFESKVRPILVERCYSCHGPESNPVEGGLYLNSRAAIVAGGDTGPAIVPSHSDKSLLISAINYGDVYEMPPDTKMADEEIEILTKWVNDGAPWPKEAAAELATTEAFDIQARKKAHWSWKPIRKPTVPKIKQADWPKDPIDHFILAGVENADLTPAQPASRRTLIRRAYFDIIGLPPTPEQVQAFVDDQSPNAFEKIVDELLASPRYGERWARHWMDLARYAETGGHEFDYAINYAHEYRDYLIRTFNADVSYKQFVHEQIAGDLIKNPRRHLTEAYNESVLGTGFWFLGEAKHGPVDSKAEEAMTIDNQIDVMSKSFLGLTVACARCHDHKFDAISTEDYYALAGFLQSSRREVALLDPDRIIENRFGHSLKLVRAGGKAADEVIERLSSASGDKAALTLAKYLNASLEVLRTDEDWNRESTTTFEGESLKQINVDSGETLEQMIPHREGLKWSNEKQYWWKHGKIGDSWVLEFNAGPKPKKSQVVAVMTYAGDYGAATIKINDKIVIDKHDFFDPGLSNKKLELGKLTLKPGKNRLTFTLLEPNPKAAPSHMLGIDTLSIIPVQKELPKGSLATLESNAKRDNLNEELLGQSISAIKTLAGRKEFGALKILGQTSKRHRTVDGAFAAELKKSAKKLIAKAEKFQNESTLFADFKTGLPDAWFRSGYAFGDAEMNRENKFATIGPGLRTTSAIHSGQHGGKFFGVVRSPTFEITHSHIHHRIRGNKRYGPADH